MVNKVIISNVFSYLIISEPTLNCTSIYRFNILIISLQVLNCIIKIVMRPSYYSMVECMCLIAILYSNDIFARVICSSYPKWDSIEITKYKIRRENFLWGHLFSNRGIIRSQISSWPDTATQSNAHVDLIADAAQNNVSYNRQFCLSDIAPEVY